MPGIEAAREFLGEENCIDPASVLEYMGLKDALASQSFRPMLFTASILKACRETHLLLPFWPCSIQMMQERFPDLFFEQDWYEGEKFLEAQGQARWWLVRKTRVQSSESKDEYEQGRLLASNEVQMPAHVMAFLNILYFRARGFWLMRDVTARSTTSTKSGGRVSVGVDGAVGKIDINRSSNGARLSHLVAWAARHPLL